MKETNKTSACKHIGAHRHLGMTYAGEGSVEHPVMVLFAAASVAAAAHKELDQLVVRVTRAKDGLAVKLQQHQKINVHQRRKQHNEMKE